MTFGVYTDVTNNASILAKDPIKVENGNENEFKHKFVSTNQPFENQYQLLVLH